MSTIKDDLINYVSNLNENDLKKFLDEIKSKTVNKPFVYTDIKSYEDACNVLDVSEEDKIYVTDSKYIIALKKLVHIFKVINNGWEPDYTNSDEYKYYPYFKVLPSGLGYSNAGYGCDNALTYVGVRLCTNTSVKAEYIGKQFKDLYEDYLL